MITRIRGKLLFAIIAGVISFVLFNSGSGWATDFSVAFYYGDHAPF